MVGGDVPWTKFASDGSFGHTGAGGCVSFGDVDNQVWLKPGGSRSAAVLFASCALRGLVFEPVVAHFVCVQRGAVFLKHFLCVGTLSSRRSRFFSLHLRM
jgi:hypothetical protein